MKYVYTILAILFLFCGTSVFAQTSRGAFVEDINNEHSSFAVRVDVNHSSRIYTKDDLLQATVTSSENGYLYLFYRDAVGNVSVLFPNRFQQENSIRKNETVAVPAPGSNFKIRMDAPFGSEMLKAVVSLKPLTYIDTAAFIGASATPVNETTAKSFSKSFEKNTPDWAEHQVVIQTVPPTTNNQPVPVSSDGGKRFAVCVGISDYKDSNINKLGICHIDSGKILNLLTERCGVAKENAFHLANEQATLANIRDVVTKGLPSLTKPGDTIFMFWSGHGSQTEDQKKEFLIPYDGSGNDIPGTMLMDETFGRWLQDLDGRKILVILDACHSGGMANNAKMLPKGLNDDKDWQPLRFGLTRLALMKDIGQKDAALIASSTSSEISFVRREKDLSVLTYYILQAFEESKKETRPLTHVQLCETIKPQVAQYVESSFPGRKQSVVMQDDMTEPLILNP